MKEKTMKEKAIKEKTIKENAKTLLQYTIRLVTTLYNYLEKKYQEKLEQERVRQAYSLIPFIRSEFYEWMVCYPLATHTRLDTSSPNLIQVEPLAPNRFEIHVPTMRRELIEKGDVRFLYETQLKKNLELSKVELQTAYGNKLTNVYKIIPQAEIKKVTQIKAGYILILIELENVP